jgi:hypothetical protein
MIQNQIALMMNGATLFLKKIYNLHMKTKLTSNDSLTQLLYSNGIVFWEDALLFIKQIPYGRNANRVNFSLVLKENKGTCSTKHAFLKEIANRNHISNIELIVGLYKMNEANTRIGSILSDNNIEYIPEAHCYLKISGERLDLTSKESDFEKIKSVLIEEIIIEPYQVGDFKVNYHKEYLKNWLNENGLSHTFEQLWRIREKCIENLSLH